MSSRLAGAALGGLLWSSHVLAQDTPGAGSGPSPAREQHKRVAVIIAISQYPDMPAELQLSQAKDQARQLADYLETSGGYDAVHLLLNGTAGSAGVRQLLIETVPGTLSGGDTLFVAFLGHGVGGDFGDPSLLLYDTTFDKLDTTALQLNAFALELAQAVAGNSLVFVTDASHEGELGGAALIGPSAKSWPNMPGDTFLLSAAGPNEVSGKGSFVPLLLDALQGEADANADGVVTASELHRRLLVSAAEATGDTVHPAEAGTYDANLVVSTAIRGPTPVAATPSPPALPAPKDKTGFGGPVSFAMIGAGAAMGLGSTIVGIRARELNSRCAAADSGCSAEDKATATAQFRQYYGLMAGAALVGGTGIVLGTVPLEGGAGLGIWGSF